MDNVQIPEDKTVGEDVKNIRDSAELQALFDSYLWEKIFTFIEDPEDFINLTISSPYFSFILNPRKTLLLFPKVWKVMNKYHHRQASLYGHYRHYLDTDVYYNGQRQRFCHGCNRWISELWFKSTLLFRQICVYWSYTIDNILQVPAGEYHESRDPLNSAICVEFFDNLCFNLDMIGEVEGFLEHFQETHPPFSMRSPFLSKSVTFRFTVLFANDYDTHHTRQTPIEYLDFLEKYGHHIFSLNLGALGYVEIVQITAQLPNLKSLSIKYGCPWEKPSNPLFEIEQLETGISMNHMSSIMSIQRIQFNHVPYLIMTEVIKRNSQISYLSIDNGRFELPNLGKIQFCNLNELRISISSLQQFIMLESIQRRFPIKKLNLILNDCYDLSKDWSRIFNLLKDKWASTLNELEIFLPIVKMTDEPEREITRSVSLLVPCKMPKLKYLKLRVANLLSVGFLLPIGESVEDIFIDYLFKSHPKWVIRQHEGDIETKLNIKTLSCSKNYLPDLIWNSFPLLQNMVIKEEYKNEPLHPLITSNEEKKFTRKNWQKSGKERND